MGHAHGGVIGALADIAANLVCKSPTVTLEYKINFLKPAAGEMLIARSSLLQEGFRAIIAQSEVFTLTKGKEIKVAICLATLTRSQRPSVPAPSEAEKQP